MKARIIAASVKRDSAEAAGVSAAAGVAGSADVSGIAGGAGSVGVDIGINIFGLVSIETLSHTNEGVGHAGRCSLLYNGC